MKKEFNFKHISQQKKIVKTKFLKLLNRSNQNIQNGRFNFFSKRKKQNIYKRLKRYAQRLQVNLRWTAAGFALMVTTSIPSFGQTFERIDDINSPFVFHKNPLKDTPLAGGTSVTFGDIDADGDLDVFLGEQPYSGKGNVYYRENIGDVANPIFGDTIANPFGISAGQQVSVPYLVDLDGDGDLDLFVGEGAGVFNYYENFGTSQSPNFANPIESPFGLNIPYDVYKVSPAFVDIDNDGDLDLFLNGYYNALHFFENQGTSTAPAFASAETNGFGLTNFGYYLDSDFTFHDIDEDGDFDFFGGHGSDIVYFENIGTNVLPDFSSPEIRNPFSIVSTSQDDAPKFVDIDNDGDFDLFNGSAEGELYFQKNNGGGAPTIFEISEAHVRGRSAATLGDIDNDGDLDAFVGNHYGDIYFYKNNGTASFPNFYPIPLKNPFDIKVVGGHASPALVDIDNDGDQDLFVGTWIGKTRFFENIGDANNPTFSLDQDGSPFGISSVEKKATPTFIDIDGDGDLDAFAGKFNGDIIFFQNNGDINVPSFDAPSTNPFGFSNVGNYTNITFLDGDEDGDFDAVVGEIDGTINLFENQGSATNPNFVLQSSTSSMGLEKVDFESIVTFADLDNDNDVDAIVGGTLGKLTYFENTTPITVGLTSLPKMSNIHVFPNPVNELLQVSFGKIENGNFQLINAQGQVVRFQNFSKEENVEMNVSDVPAGFYHLKIKNSNTEIIAVKPIVIFKNQ